MSKCLNCGTELVQSPRKRKKKYCNSTCRSNKWQKKARKKAAEPKMKVKKPGKKTGQREFTMIVSKEFKDTFDAEVKKLAAPKTLKELKEMVPAGLAGLERSSWIAENRKRYNV